MRIGAKKRPFYRVVAVDERKKRTGGYLDLLGTYNPLTEPKEIKLDQNKIDAWMKKGAIPSDGFLRIIGKAPQRPPRKPKKDKKGAATPPPAEARAEEPKAQQEPTKETQSQPAVEASAEAITGQPENEKSSETKEGEETKTEGEDK